MIAEIARQKVGELNKILHTAPHISRRSKRRGVPLGMILLELAVAEAIVGAIGIGRKTLRYSRGSWQPPVYEIIAQSQSVAVGYRSGIKSYGICHRVGQ